MKIIYLLVLFSLLICAYGVSGQATDKEKFETAEHINDWQQIETPTSGLFREYLDYNYLVLPNKNIEYWKKTIYKTTTYQLFEVDCQNKQRRLLKVLGAYYEGKTYPEYWQDLDESTNGIVAAMVCKLSKPAAKTKIIPKRAPRKSKRRN
jgi:hypothetical protein